MGKWRTIRNTTTLENAFEELRKNADNHAGMGSIVLSPKDQEELCRIVRTQQFAANDKCGQMLSFCLWVTGEKGGRIEEGKEEETVWEWSRTLHPYGMK